MKLKRIVSLAVLAALLAALVIPASAKTISIAYEANVNGADNWACVYVPIATRDLAHVAAAEAPSGSNGYKAKVPGDDSASMYIHPGQAKSAASGDTNDIGLKFTAPTAGVYTIDFTAYAYGYVGDASSDGFKVYFFDKAFTAIETMTMTDTPSTLANKTLTMAAGDSFYIFFNKNGTIYSDNLAITTLSATISTDIVFPADPAPAVAVVDGMVFNQYFNIANTSGMTPVWKPFFYDAAGVQSMVADPSGKYILPAPYNTGNNQYAHIWENVGNALMPGETVAIGDYFIAPAKGTVKVDCAFSYKKDPGGNPASADGIGVTLYKNDLDTVLKAREVFDFANSSSDAGKALVVENIAVNAGDKIIFVYDCNDTIYEDTTAVLKKQVVYTAVDAPVAPISPSGGVSIVGGKISVVKTATIAELLTALNLNSLCSAAVIGMDNAQIADQTKLVTEIKNVQLYSNGHLIQTYELILTDAPAGNGNGGESGNGGAGNGTGVQGGGNQDSNGKVDSGANTPVNVLVLSALMALGAVMLLAKRKQHA